MPITVDDVRRAIEDAYPPELAEPWDRVGLLCGDPAAEVRTVAFALEATDRVVRAAHEAGAQMLIVHHPLLLRGVYSVAADQPKGRILHYLITHGIALMAAHTNADSARPGVNDRLAELLGLIPGRPITPKPAPARDQWSINVPPEAAPGVKDALFAAGAGTVGAYAECSWQVEGRGQFRPLAGAEPAVGAVGALHESAELVVRFVAPRRLRVRLLDALRSAHPYEEPAFHVVEMADDQDLNSACGLGRLGTLPEPMTLRDFTQFVADRLPETVWGVRAAGDPDREVRLVAVSSGAGDSQLAAAAALGADVIVTSDLRHHPVDEHLAAGGPAVIDTSHWASEYPWTSQAAEIVARATGATVRVLPVRTDPWTLSAHPRHEKDAAQ